MIVHRVIYEYGIEAEIEVGKGWFLTSAPEAGRTYYDSIQKVSVAVQRKPLLGIERRPDGTSHNWLFDRQTLKLFGISLSEVMNRRLDGSNFLEAYRVQYSLGSITYHCIQLAEAYAETCRAFARFANRSKIKSPTHLFTGGPAEPYFEFDAFLSAGRNAYRSALWALWKRWGRKHAPPDQFPDAVELAEGIPEPLRKRLLESWTNHGSKLKDYRDCIHHYDPLDKWLGSVWMKQVPGDAWSAFVRIPDNPEDRVHRKFTYKLDLDALMYAMGTVEELFEVMVQLVETAIPKELLQTGEGVTPETIPDAPSAS